ncbi:GNAT family N-acetyltransferase [Flexivirga oryzae]|uniref:Ribosomal protein S18 acetylase RimI-like enzyme n=1 Tax=Flexivirga oryzae TaxID=1794944 RepID=A0A839NC60_9MICO|nr:GNAT family N-acetyltransferase [Flexivirga oryzae]MBB2893853.1 ribosomal protein S18 acetylase RimI-like enzyme [Flexivirga oryzae]
MTTERAASPDLTGLRLDPAAFPGWQVRALRFDDAGAVATAMAASELHDTGLVSIEEADIVGDWQRPSFDIAACTVGVFTSSGELAAYAEYPGADRYDATVRPPYRGRGLGTALADWVCARARAKGAAMVGMPVPAGSDGERLLRGLGFAERWTSWALRLPTDVRIDRPHLPDGHRIRNATSVADRSAAYDVLEDAFLEWSDRRKATYADFAAQTYERPGFADWHMRVLCRDAPTGEEEVVAAVFSVIDSNHGSVYVDRLAVRADARRQGHARALLADVFEIGRTHGATGFELSTDSRTGALGLYTGLGMEVTSTWVNLAARLGVTSSGP